MSGEQDEGYYGRLKEIDKEATNVVDEVGRREGHKRNEAMQVRIECNSIISTGLRARFVIVS